MFIESTLIKIINNANNKAVHHNLPDNCVGIARLSSKLAKARVFHIFSQGPSILLFNR